MRIILPLICPLAELWTLYSHISPFIFTNTLLPLLRKTASLLDTDVRIITTSSSEHAAISRSYLPNGFATKADLNGPGRTEDDSFNAQRRRYGLSKLANIFFTKGLAERLDADAGLPSGGDQNGGRILAMCFHPGAVMTEGNLKTASSLRWPLSSLAQLFMRAFFRTPAQGAQCAVDAATASLFRAQLAEYQGRYLVPAKGDVSVKLGKVTELAMDEKLARELWDLTERVLKEEGIEV